MAWRSRLLGNERICCGCDSQQCADFGEGPKNTFREDFRELRLSPITDLLVVSNILLYVAMARSAGAIAPSAEDLIRWGGNYAPLTAYGQWWRLFSAAFLHLDPWHLYFNMIGLLGFGSIVERAYGKSVIMGVYLACIFAASSTSMVWHPFIVTLGASGGVFGLLGFLIPPLAAGGLSVHSKRLRNPAQTFCVSLAFNLIISAIVPFIDNSAHIGGLTAGLGIGFAFVLLGNRATVQLQWL